MRYVAGVVLLSAALCAQTGQEGPRPGWPCVAGRPADPSYLEVSESTGGQLFLFQKGEVQHSAVVMSASHTHPATVLRAVGHLNGMREFTFPVDSTITSLLVMASLQCRKEVAVSRPSGSEMTAANSAQSIDLQAGRILRVDTPDFGTWRVRLTGTGLFVLSVLAQSPVRLGVNLAQSTASASVAGEVTDVRFGLIGPGSEPLAGAGPAEVTDGRYQFAVSPPQERFRIVMTGTDALGNPVQRTHPVLFRAQHR